MLNDLDARWLRARFDEVVHALGEAMATTRPGDPLDGAATAALGAATAYANAGIRLGVLDRELAIELLRSYADDDYWAQSLSDRG